MSDTTEAPQAKTSSGRVARFRAARKTRTIELPLEAMEALKAISQRDGDASATAACVRLIMRARARTPRG